MIELLIITLYDSDCGGLIPPCWQELHYLFAGVMIGFVLAFPIYEQLRRRWSNDK